MNFDEFVSYLTMIGGVKNVAADPVKPYKIEVSRNMAPHYYGDIPKALTRAFPNESDEILGYRVANYRAKTKTLVTTAIGEVFRLFSSSRYSIEINQDLAQYIAAPLYGGAAFVPYFFSAVYPMRVIDPNGLLLFNVAGEGVTNEAAPIEIDPVFITSDRIYNDYKRDGFLMYSPPPSEAAKVLAYIVTSEFYGKILKTSNGGTEVVEVYTHNLGFYPFVQLGGRAVVRFVDGRAYVVNDSDFGHALPYLDDLAVVSNQALSVLLSSCFPIKLVTGVTCEPCHGRGYRHSDDGLDVVACAKCKGTGRTFFSSPLAGYYLTPPPDGATDEERKLAASMSPIRYEGPPIDSVVVLNNERDKTERAAENALNIQKAVELAQSGRAKEIDRERDYVAIGRVAEDFFNKLSQSLKIIQGLRFLDVDSPIVVNAPRSFDIKNESGLLAEFLEAMKDTPPNFRFSAYMDFIKRRLSSDKKAQRIAALAASYSPLYLYSTDEREALLLARTISREDAIKAVFVFSALQNLLNKGFDIYQDEAAIFAAIDEELSERLTPPVLATEPPPSPNMLGV